MRYRFLGHSGLKVSELTYGNWVTHGSQIGDDAAEACVRAALDCGITSFDTADVYARGRAEEILGRALEGQRREGLEIFTKVYGPMGDGPNDVGLSRKHIREGIEASLRRLQLEYVDLYQAHRYDYETPLEETMQAFADVVRSGKALYIGVSEWRGGEIPEAQAPSREMHVPPVSNQPQYSRATDEAGGGAKFISRLLRDDVLERVQQLRPLADEAGLSMAALALAWVLQEENVASAIIGATRPEQVRDNVQAVGVRLDPELKRRIDELLAPVAETDPALTKSPNPRG